ncbi:hypothetical protein A9Q84_18530 [Halobacteriovorax marinus]|uniref:Uncharacterized protein n=1 Tax=Halobacteriovorax marinus TaxID=97084 RepID=A0A1Y5F220_9BACT|nr:hypothetical protein A9Q84_18530 [Halobacteriovorax marinus]
MFTLERFMFAFVLIASIAGAVISHQNLGWYEGVYVKEDGFIEWMTVLGLLIGAVACYYRISILKPFRGKLFLFCLFVLGSLFLFGLGEEISWGQRIFDIKSSEFFMKNNSQAETNFHNLVVGGKKINKIIFGTLLGIMIGFYFLILPVLYRKVEKVKKLVDSMAVPLPKNFHIVAYLILVGITELIAGGKKGEILEFGGVWIFVLMTFRPYNREIFSRKSFR